MFNPPRQNPVTPIRSTRAAGFLPAQAVTVGDRVDHLPYGVDVGPIDDASLPRVGFIRYSQKSFHGETAGDILDVLVHPEDFRDDQDDRVPAGSGWAPLVDGHLEIPRGHLAVGDGDAR